MVKDPVWNYIQSNIFADRNHFVTGSSEHICLWKGKKKSHAHIS